MEGGGVIQSSPLDILRKQDGNRSINILQGLSTKKSQCQTLQQSINHCLQKKSGRSAGITPLLTGYVPTWLCSNLKKKLQLVIISHDQIRFETCLLFSMHTCLKVWTPRKIEVDIVVHQLSNFAGQNISCRKR